MRFLALFTKGWQISAIRGYFSKYTSNVLSMRYLKDSFYESFLAEVKLKITLTGLKNVKF